MMNLREIDWFVAEKVMNWHVWENEDGDLMVTKGYGCYSHCPSFSTNIADAWQVVEKLKELGFHVGIKTPPKAKSTSYWVCVEDFYAEKTFTSYGLTAPLAICLAALKAVGIEVETE
jgi:hypothetical protein